MPAGADERHHRVDVRVLPHDVRDLALQFDHRVERDVLRTLDEAEELAGVLARQEALRRALEQHAGGDADDEEHDHARRARWRSDQRRRRVVGVRARRRSRARTPCTAGRGAASVRCGLRMRLHIIGVSVSETKPEISTAAMMVTANSCSRRPRMPPMNSTGMNTAASEIVIEMMVNTISLRAVERRLQHALALLDVARDVLQHDDGVVDHEADAQRQRHQRDVVQAVAEAGTSPRRCRRCDIGSAMRRDDGRRDVAQEEEDHQHHQQQREAQRELHLVDRGADGVASGRRASRCRSPAAPRRGTSAAAS